MFKKGELTTQQIVILIILVVSFAIILFFLFKLNLGKQTDQDICHNSVITRGKSILPTDTFPLQCKRQYVCLSVDGTCESMTKPEVIKVKTQDDVYKALADQLAQCWWMFGEGKINYVGADTNPQWYCSICSQIAFDNSVKSISGLSSGEMSSKGFYNYLSSHNYSSSQSYAQYFYKTNQIQNNFQNVNLDHQYYSLMGIKSKTDKVTWAFIGGAVFVAGALTGGAGWVIGGIALATGGAAGYFIAPVVQGDSGNYYISPSLIEPNSPEMKALNCQEISTSS